MSLYEKFKQREASLALTETGELVTLEPSELSTLEAVELAPTLRRAKLVFDYFGQTIKEAKGSKIGFLIQKFTEELLDEAADIPDEVLEFYMRQSTAILYFAATGERIINMPMPQDFINYLPPDLIPAGVEKAPEITAEQRAIAAKEIEDGS